MTRRNTPEKFWEKVDTRGCHECWEWQGYATKGYGFLRYKNLTPGSKRHLRAHQVAWALTNNCAVNPPGQDLHHTCGNKLCCNPMHLQLMSHADHMGIHRGYGCHIHGYEDWRTQPSGQHKCAICNNARRRESRERAARLAVPTVVTTNNDEG